MLLFLICVGIALSVSSAVYVRSRKTQYWDGKYYSVRKGLGDSLYFGIVTFFVSMLIIFLIAGGIISFAMPRECQVERFALQPLEDGDAKKVYVKESYVADYDEIRYNIIFKSDNRDLKSENFNANNTKIIYDNDVKKPYAQVTTYCKVESSHISTVTFTNEAMYGNNKIVIPKNSLASINSTKGVN